MEPADLALAMSLEERSMARRHEEQRSAVRSLFVTIAAGLVGVPGFVAAVEDLALHSRWRGLHLLVALFGVALLLSGWRGGLTPPSGPKR